MNMDMEKEKIALFNSFFKGRTDTFAEQISSNYNRIAHPISDLDIRNHLNGLRTYGIYLIDPSDSTGRLLVLDVDNKDNYYPNKLIGACEKAGIVRKQILVESSGDKGYHLWLFFEEKLGAQKIRKLGQVIVALSGIKQSIEIFPKQDRVSANNLFGSLIKLPFGIHQVTGRRSIFLNDKLQPETSWFDGLRNIRRVSNAEVEIILDEFSYILPKLQPMQVKQSKGLPCITKITQGAGKGKRELAGFRLAVHYFNSSIPRQQAKMLLSGVNQKNHPPLPAAKIEDIINSVYTKGYTGYHCDEEVLKEYCSPECPISRKIAKTQTLFPPQKSIGPGITLDELKKAFKKYLYFDDYDVIDATFGTIIVNRKNIDPVWIFLVDTPSSGKTELLRSLQDCPGIILVSGLTAQSLTSGKTSAKNFMTSKDPSLFAELNNRILIVKDFTNILNLRSEDQNKIFSQMRDSYDGFYDAKFGMEGKVYRYKTHYGFIGGVTLAIDKAYLLQSTMGERYLKYRMQNDREKALAKARKNRGCIKELREELNSKVRQFLGGFQDLGEILWNEEDEKLVESIADVVTMIRTPVNRDWRDFKIIEVVPEPEMPMRFANSLKNFGDGIAEVRGKSKITAEELKVVKKCAFDCLPKKIVRIVDALYAFKIPTKHSDLARAVGLNTETVTRACQDLFAIGVIDMRNLKGTYHSSLKDRILEKLDLIHK